MKVENARWVLVLKVDQGHRYFREKETGKVGVADNSGLYPDTTEDGVLYLDPSRPILCTFNSASIPLVDSTGRQSWTGEYALGGLQVAREFGLTFQAQGDLGHFLKVWDAIPKGDKRHLEAATMPLFLATYCVAHTVSPGDDGCRTTRRHDTRLVWAESAEEAEKKLRAAVEVDEPYQLRILVEDVTITQAVK